MIDLGDLKARAERQLNPEMMLPEPEMDAGDARAILTLIAENERLRGVLVDIAADNDKDCDHYDTASAALQEGGPA